MKNLFVITFLFCATAIFAQTKPAVTLPLETKQDTTKPVFTAISNDTIAPVLIVYFDDKLQLVSETGFCIVQQGYFEKDGRRNVTTISQPVVMRPTTTTTALPNGKEDKKTTNQTYPIRMELVIYLLDNSLNVLYKK